MWGCERTAHCLLEGTGLLDLSCCACCCVPVQVAKNDGSGQQVLMKSRRIDGSTTLDMREAAIKEFNNPDSGECAAGVADKHRSAIVAPS